MKKIINWISLIIILSYLAIGINSALAQTYPSTWIFLASDGAENGTADDIGDVANVSYNYDSDYIYLQMVLRAQPDWPNGGNLQDNRYKWFFDTDSDLYFSGGNILESEFLLFVEDSLNNTDNTTGEDALGEIYLLNDTDGDGEYTEFENPNDYHPNRVDDTGIAGFRIIGNNMEMYVLRTAVNGSSLRGICVSFATDQENPNLDQAPTSDRPDGPNYCFSIAPPITTTTTTIPTTTTTVPVTTTTISSTTTTFQETTTTTIQSTTKSVPLTSPTLSLLLIGSLLLLGAIRIKSILFV